MKEECRESRQLVAALLVSTVDHNNQRRHGNQSNFYADMDEGVVENFSYEYDEKGRITGVYDGAEDDMERVLWFEIKY